MSERKSIFYRCMMLLPVASVIAVVTSPVSAQSLLDSVRGLKRTAEQLVGRNSPQQSSGGQSGTDGAGVADDMIGADYLAVDASDTTLGASPLRMTEVTTFDVRGLRLGMSPREINRVARKIGARRDGVMPATSGDFGVEATRQANQGLGRPISDQSKRLWRGGGAKLRNGGDLHAQTELEPSGPKLSTLSYSTSLEGQSPVEFRQSVIAKYGQPDVTNANGRTTQMLWCSKLRPANAKGKSLGETTSDCEKIRLGIETYSAAPYFSVSYDQNMAWFTLNRGKSYRDAVATQLTDRANEIRQSTGRKAEF